MVQETNPDIVTDGSGTCHDFRLTRINIARKLFKTLRDKIVSEASAKPVRAEPRPYGLRNRRNPANCPGNTPMVFPYDEGEGNAAPKSMAASDGSPPGPLMAPFPCLRIYAHRSQPFRWVRFVLVTAASHAHEH